MDIQTILKNISQKYTPLSLEALQDLLEVAEFLTPDKQEVLVREGQHCQKIFYIIEGTVRAYYLKAGRDITDWFAFENDFVCSINSFFHQQSSLHYIETLEPSVLMVVTKEHLTRLVTKHLTIDHLEKAVITQTMLQLQQRIVSVQFETAKQKYKNLIEIRPDITLRVPLTHIASYLGITLETLSRIRSNKTRI